MNKVRITQRGTQKDARPSVSTGRMRWLIPVIVHPVSLFLLATVGIGIGASSLWREYRQFFANNPRFEITEQRVAITSPNEWVTEDPRVRLCQAIRERKLTLLNAELVEVAAQLTSGFPYVDTVQNVEKSATGLSISAVYRTPRALVNLGDGRFQRIDRSAIVMGPQISSVDSTESLIRINVYLPVAPALQEWHRFPDERIEAAAEITDALKSNWQELGLYQVVSFWPAGIKLTEDATFELWTANGGRVVWTGGGQGEFPSVTDGQKIESLKNWIAINGSLEKLAGWKMIDIRDGNVKLVPEARASFNDSGMVSPF